MIPITRAEIEALDRAYCDLQENPGSKTRQQRFREKLRSIMRSWRQHPCEVCGNKRRSREFAHLRPTGLSGRGRGQYTRVYDIIKHPDHYAIMCTKCHGLFDRGLLRHHRDGKGEWFTLEIRRKM